MMVMLAALIFAINPLVMLFLAGEFVTQFKKDNNLISNITGTYFGMVILVFFIFGFHFIIFKLFGKNLSFANYFKLHKDYYNYIPNLISLIAMLFLCLELQFAYRNPAYILLRSLVTLAFFFGVYMSLVLYLNWLVNAPK